MKLSRAMQRGRRPLTALVAVCVWLGACAPVAPPVAGEAVLTEIINNIQVGANPGTFELARNGTGVAEGNIVSSGESSLGKLSFSDGPFVRFTSFTTFSRVKPETPEEVRLKLEAGRLRFALFGHLFGALTPLGLAQLDGFGDLTYRIGSGPDITDDELTFNCFAGPCLFQSEVALVYTQLNSMEGILVTDGGMTVTRIVLSELDLRQFILDNPGSVSVIATLTAQPTATPTPTNTPRPTLTASSTPTVTPTETPTVTPTRTRRPTQIATPIPSVTATGSQSPTPTETPTEASSGGGGGGPPPSNTPVPPTNTPVPPPTNTPEPTVTEAPTKTPPP